MGKDSLSERPNAKIVSCHFGIYNEYTHKDLPVSLGIEMI
jgi:hypothetical protein